MYVLVKNHPVVPCRKLRDYLPEALKVLTILLILGLSVFPGRSAAQSELQYADGSGRMSYPTLPKLSALEMNAAKLQRKITVDFDNVPLAGALSQIAAQADLKVSLGHGLLDGTDPVTLHAEDVTVLQALQETLRGSGLWLQISPTGYLILIPYTDNVTKAQEAATVEEQLLPQHQVSGTVTSAEDGQPLPGVNVVVKGTATGAATGIDGEYSLVAPSPNDTLIFSFIGYIVQEVPIAGRSVVDVALVPDTQELDEVVVIGFGEKTRRLMTESIGTVSTDEIRKLPVASPDQAIQGRISGVQVTNVSGLPGSPVAVRIRGVGTVGNTQPLYVIDGVPVGRGGGEHSNPLASINPADIESISVLKDASAAATYGMQAANGVVLITTRRGQMGKPTITFDSYAGIQQFPQLWEMLSTEELLKLDQVARDNYNKQMNLEPGSPSYLTQHPDLSDPVLRARDNSQEWIDAAANKNAPIQNYNLSVSGATDRLNYFVSAGYFNQEAIIKHWTLDRYSFRANSDYQVTDWFKLGQTFSLSHEYMDRGVNAGGDGFLLNNAAEMPPFFQIYDENNEIPGNRYGFHGNLDVAGIVRGNQVGMNEIVWNHNYDTRVLGGLNALITLPYGFSYESRAAIDYGIGKSYDWRPPFTAAELGFDRNTPEFNDTRTDALGQNFFNALRFDNTFGGHSLNVLAGVEVIKGQDSRLNVGGQNFLSLNPNFFMVVRNAETKQIRGNMGEWGSVGYITRVSYDYNEKYLLTATIRRDGSYRFSPEGGRRWGTFPSISAAWRISEEPFFNFPAVSELKLRGSWGQLGNDETAWFPHVFRLSVIPDYGSGETTKQAPSPVSFVNKDVTWETVETTDFGVDVSLFNNKLDILATYYNRLTKDFLIGIPLPRITGFSRTSVNAGTVLNRGVELEANYNFNIGQAFFDVGANLTTVYNELVEIAPGISEYSSGNYRTAVGYPIGYFFGYKTDGFYNTAEEAAQAPLEPSRSHRPQPGDVRFLDINRPKTEEDNLPEEVLWVEGEPDGQLTPEDRTMLGKTIPGYFYGLNLNGYWKGFDLSLFFQGVGDVQIYNEHAAGHMGGTEGYLNKLKESMDYWTPENKDAKNPRPVATDPNGNNRFSDRWIENGDFLRLKSLQIGWTLPQSITTSTVQRARVYLSMTNLFTITPYSGLDPEVMTYGSAGSQTSAGTDQGNVPQPRTFQVGVQLQF